MTAWRIERDARIAAGTAEPLPWYLSPEGASYDTECADGRQVSIPAHKLDPAATCPACRQVHPTDDHR